MKSHRFQFRCHRQPFFTDHIAIFGAFIAEENGVRKVRIAGSPVLHELTPDEACCEQEPMLTLSAEDTQGLMDELWRCGFRPTEGTGSAGSLAATQKHLEDMRSLVFKTLLPS
ncbi:MAG: hypothetical protein M0Q93_00425 [Terrimicrobiaceae bacterium]|nr:hypothetical protein [Terrimicrobiaceae bacterium]